MDTEKVADTQLPEEDIPQEAPVQPEETPQPQQDAAEEIRGLKETLAKANENIETLVKQFSKVTEAHQAEIAELKASLPKITTDEKTVVEGYFDYDLRAERMLHAEARNDYDRAKADFAILKTIIR